MRLPSAVPSSPETDIFEQRALAARYEQRIETALEFQFRRVENLLRTMDALTTPKGGRR
jgi:hypothetical protein